MAIGILGVAMIFIAGVFPVGLHFATVSTERTIAVVVADEAFAKLRLYAEGIPDFNPTNNPNDPRDYDDINLAELKPHILTDLTAPNVFPAARYFDPSFDPMRYIDPNGLFGYPSKDTDDIPDELKQAVSNGAIPSLDPYMKKQYYWSALGKSLRPFSYDDRGNLIDSIDPNLFDPNMADPNSPDPKAMISNRAVQVTVFVCRKTGENLWYPNPVDPLDLDPNLSTAPLNRPVPVAVPVTAFDYMSRELMIADPAYNTFINDGSTIVHGRTGEIYHVLERYKPPQEGTLLLNQDIDPNSFLGDGRDRGGEVWVAPPPINGGRNPCIAVYQKKIRF